MDACNNEIVAKAIKLSNIPYNKHIVLVEQYVGSESKDKLDFQKELIANLILELKTEQNLRYGCEQKLQQILHKAEDQIVNLVSINTL